MLQHRYYLYQRTFPIHEYGVWLEISYMKRFFVTAVYRVTTQSNVILVEGGSAWKIGSQSNLAPGWTQDFSSILYAPVSMPVPY